VTQFADRADDRDRSVPVQRRVLHSPPMRSPHLYSLVLPVLVVGTSIASSLVLLFWWQRVFP